MKSVHIMRAVPFLALGLLSCAAPREVQHETGGAVDPLVGDWEGHRVEASGTVVPIAYRILAQGGMEYRAVPDPEFARGIPTMQALDFQFDGKNLVSGGPEKITGTLSGEIITGSGWRDRALSFSLKRVSHRSPTSGAVPPPGATVLFNGPSLQAWTRVPDTEGPHSGEIRPAGWKLVEGGAMEVVAGAGSIVTRSKFRDFTLHLEFRTPFMPEARGQGRGNSGVYLQGRYEVQVLDSYGLTGEDNECGGIYKVSRPRVNMCAPPGQWQTFDVIFRAPRFNDAGAKVEDAGLTVLHNGVPIHERLTVPGPTGGALDNDVRLPGGLMLQDHGNPVQYRNIWLVETP